MTVLFCRNVLRYCIGKRNRSGNCCFTFSFYKGGPTLVLISSCEKEPRESTIKAIFQLLWVGPGKLPLFLSSIVNSDEQLGPQFIAIDRQFSYKKNWPNRGDINIILWLLVIVLLNDVWTKVSILFVHSLLKEKKISNKLQSCLKDVDVDLISSLPRTLLICFGASDMQLQSSHILTTCDLLLAIAQVTVKCPN